MSKAGLGTIQITKFDNGISILYFDADGEKHSGIASFDQLEKLIGVKGIRSICRDEIRGMLGDISRDRWKSLETGTSFAFNPLSPLSGRVMIEPLSCLS
jgi:hypothetical protein